MSPRTKEQYEKIRSDRREEILSAALKLFSRDGYHATTISIIAKHAGISKGLMYNYFESKDDLLRALICDYVVMMSSLFNPDGNDEISNEEMKQFFGLLKESMIRNNDLWKLYYRLSVQPEVFEFIKSIMDEDEVLLKHQTLFLRYFSERFENPAPELLLFSSLIKGFALQYVMTPEMFPDEVMSPFFQKLESLFVKEKIARYRE